MEVSKAGGRIHNNAPGSLEPRPEAQDDTLTVRVLRKAPEDVSAALEAENKALREMNRKLCELTAGKDDAMRLWLARLFHCAMGLYGVLDALPEDSIDEVYRTIFLRHWRLAEFCYEAAVNVNANQPVPAHIAESAFVAEALALLG